MRLFGQLALKIDEEAPALRPFVEMIHKNFERVKRPDTEIVVHTIKKGLSNVEHLNYPGFRFFNDREILKSILNAENDEYDGVIVLCAFDSALRAARQMLDIPVVGMLESSMHLAAMMGRQFAIITSEALYIPETQENILKNGMHTLAIPHLPVRAIPLSNKELMGCVAEGDFPRIIEAFNLVAGECVKDGAEVLIGGCGMLSTILTHCRLVEAEGVPIVDPVITCIKLGELMVDLRKAGLPFISRKGLYFKAPDQKIKDVINQAMFDFEA